MGYPLLMVNTLTNNFDFEIVNIYCVLQEKNVISFIRVIFTIKQLCIITVYLLTKPKFIHFSGNGQLFLS